VLGIADEERQKAQCEDGVAERRAEVLPERSRSAGIVGREKQRNHENEPAHAGGADQQAEDKTQSDGKFAVGDEKSDGRGVRQDEVAENGHHERISPTAIEEAIDPKLKAAVQRKRGAEDLVLAEDQEEQADTNTKEREGLRVAFQGRVSCGYGTCP